MSLIINTKNIFSDKIIKSLFNFDVKMGILQMDCFSKNVINNIDIIDSNFSELFNRIKVFLESYSKDDTKIKSNIVFFNKLYLLYFKGGIIVNENILIKNIESMVDLYKTNDICVIKSCVSNKLFDGIIMAKEGNATILEIINVFLNDPYTTDISELLLNSVNQNSKCIILNERIILDKSNIYGKQNEIIAEHYFKNDTLL